MKTEEGMCWKRKGTFGMGVVGRKELLLPQDSPVDTHTLFRLKSGRDLNSSQIQ